MGELGIAGAAARKKKPRTTVPAPAGQPRPPDLLERDFTAAVPGRRRVADITYVDTACGFVHTAFVTDLFSRRIVGWQVADTLRAELALDALEMAIWSCGDNIGNPLVHHSDRAVQGIPRSAMRSGWVISALSAPWGAKVIPMTTRLRNR